MNTCVCVELKEWMNVVESEWENVCVWEKESHCHILSVWEFCIKACMRVCVKQSILFQVIINAEVVHVCFTVSCISLCLVFTSTDRVPVSILFDVLQSTSRRQAAASPSPKRQPSPPPPSRSHAANSSKTKAPPPKPAAKVVAKPSPKYAPKPLPKSSPRVASKPEPRYTPSPKTMPARTVRSARVSEHC